MDTVTFVNFYEILEVPPTANAEKVKEAVKQQRRTWAKRQSHPDQQKRHEAELRIGQIARAERALLNDDSRRQYDQQLASYRPPATPAADVSGDWLERAREFLARGDANSASYAAREATQQQGNDADAWAVRARASLMLSRQNDAVFEFQEALRIQPNEPEYHFDLGTVYESDGQWNSAMQCYEAASKLAPQVVMYRLAIASVYIQNDRAAQAMPILEQAYADDPGNEIVQFYLAVGLHDHAVDSMVKLRDGTFHIISEESANKVLHMARRAQALNFRDEELRQSIRDQIAYAEGQLQVKFHAPWAGVSDIAADGCGAIAILFFIGAIVLTFPFWFAGLPAVAFLIAVPWYWLMYKWHWRPAWKITEKRSRSMRVGK
jgi:Flp pilus assembly protein TadD